MTAALRTPYALLLALFAVLSFAACIEDDPIEFEEPPVTNVETELRLDGPNLTGPILAAGVHRFGVRFSEDELEGYGGRDLIGVKVFVGVQPEYLDLIAYAGGDQAPGRELGVILAEVNRTGDFLEYTFEEPIRIDAAEPLWLVAEVELPQRQQSIGCDAGPRVAGGDWLWSGDEWLPFGERVPGESINWNLRGLVR